MKKRSLMAFFEIPATWIVDTLQLDRADGNNRRLNEDIRALSGGRKEAIREFHVKKVSQVLLASCVAILLILALMLAQSKEDTSVAGRAIERPDYGDLSREEVLIADVQGEEGEITYEINARNFTEAQIEASLQSAQKQLEERFLGENASPDMVRSALYFPSELMDGAVKIEWMTRPYGVISAQGELEGQNSEKVTDEGCLVNIEAALTCQEETLYFETAVRVYPKLMDAKESLWHGVEKALKEADENSSQEAYLLLPDEVDGKRIHWSYQKGKETLLMVLLLVLLPVFLEVKSNSDVKEKAEKRRRQLQIDYPELMWKMTMLLGAGLTIQGTFRRIAEDYRKEKADKNQRYSRFVYEEMLYTCREMKSGIPEAKAYENFGRRCELPCYIKLGTMLSQNLKKGSRGLAGLLEHEALSTSQERRNEARKMGEKAGTKLLMPMVLMFMIVLVILVVPAFMSM